MKKTVQDIDIAGKRVLMRADYNVPLQDGKVGDDFRIRASLPTIDYILGQGASLVICSHLGRPGGEEKDELKMDPVAETLANLLDKEVEKADDCIGREVMDAAESLSAGDVLLLENTRFHNGEKVNDPIFAQKLAGTGEVFVNDAFAAAHRAHASTTGVARWLPAVAGLLMEKEIKVLSRVREDPEPPLVMIFGGAKIADKIGMIESFLYKVDALLVGGGIANTFLKVEGFDIGESLVDQESLNNAESIMKHAGEKLVLPKDGVIAKAMDTEAARRTITFGEDEMPKDWKIFDIGPKTLQAYKGRLKNAKTVLWNGPMGIYELEPFASGTKDLAKAISELDAETVTGGGETAAAVYEAGLAKQMSHVSTGGGAFLTFMEGEELPGIAALEEKEEQDNG